MSADASRRDVLIGAASSTGLDLVPFVRPVRAHAAPLDPTDPFPGLLSDYQRATCNLRALDIAETAAAARYIEPELPAALLRRNSDVAHFGGWNGDRIDFSNPSRGYAYKSKTSWDRLTEERAAHAGERAEWSGAAQTLARIDEIMAAMAGWFVECNRRWAEVGLDEIRERWRAAAEECQALREQATYTPARTLQDVLTKARIASECFESFDPERPAVPPIPAEEGIREAMADQPWTRDGVLYSILLDLLAMDAVKDRASVSVA